LREKNKGKNIYKFAYGQLGRLCVTDERVNLEVVICMVIDKYTHYTVNPMDKLDMSSFRLIKLTVHLYGKLQCNQQLVDFLVNRKTSL